MIKKFHKIPIFKTFRAASIFFISAVIFSSCKIYQPAFYFKDIKRDTVISGFVNNDLEIKIQRNDILKITFSSLNSAEDALFNQVVPLVTSEEKNGFQVNLEGNIYIHKLGKVPAAGLTRKELKAQLENSLLPYLKDPIVTISFINHRITVLGEVASKLVDMPEEKISLLEVLASSGGVSTNSKSNSVMIVREKPGSKEIKHINLEDPSIFTSPWYYLQPNDIVVVKPNEEKIDDDQKRARNQLLYTSIITGITFILLIIDRIFR